MVHSVSRSNLLVEHRFSGPLYSNNCISHVILAISEFFHILLQSKYPYAFTHTPQRIWHLGFKSLFEARGLAMESHLLRSELDLSGH